MEATVIIVGGGLAGATLALALARDNISVALVESLDPHTQAETPFSELRMSALHHGSRRLLEKLGVWKNIPDHEFSAFEHVLVKDGQASETSHSSIRFEAADLAVDCLGYIARNYVVQELIWRELRASKHVELYIGDAPVSVQVSDINVCLHLESGAQLQGELIVGADGGRSWVREAVGITTRGWGYDQRAVVANIDHENSHGKTAWQSFLPQGPLALLPLADGRSSIVWTMSPERALHLTGCGEDEFLEALNQDCEAVFGVVTGMGSRMSFPLQLQHANQYVSERVALIGDAAHTVHPLAGQGANLGLMDAAALAQVVSHAVAEGKLASHFPSLRRYERWRKGENMIMMGALDGFQKLFAPQPKPVAWVRGMGLGLTDRLTPIKHFMARQAMGLSDDLPDLARR